jgi:Raf kinase inhibitor-like YbhB/YbcL family protein
MQFLLRACWGLALLAGLMVVVSAQGGNAMELKSSAFADGGKIPQPNVMPGAGGKNLSLPLQWSGAPVGTQSFALSIVDPHPVARNWVHWLVINIPGNASSLAAGASETNMPAGAVELHNSWGKTGYGGPQPPPGTGDHPYVVTLYALNVAKLDLKPATNLAGFQKAMEGKILGTAKITGYYGR